jgi:hypothetical protein
MFQHASRNIRIASTVLGLLGIIKLISLFSCSVPDTRDAVLPFRTHTLVFSMVLGELIISVCMITCLKPLRSAQCLSMIGLCFLLYRILYAASGGATKPCPCLGSATTLIPFLKCYEQNILSSFATWFLALGLWYWGKERYRL